MEYLYRKKRYKRTVKPKNHTCKTACANAVEHSRLTYPVKKFFLFNFYNNFNDFACGCLELEGIV